MEDILKVLFRTVFFYFFIMIMYRIMGKREVGQLGIVDLIVSILIAELVAISIENKDDTLLLTVVPIIALVILELSLAFASLKSKKFRNFFEGKPSLIINSGKVNYKEMVKQRYTVDDLLFELRQRSIKNLENVDYAFLEPNGKLSIFEKKLFDKDYPMPLVVDGSINLETLKNIQKSKLWFKEVLKKNNLKLEDIFYAFYKNNVVHIIKKEKN